MTPRNSDALLIDALRAGQHDAFERLYADYHAPIYNLCARIVGDREEAKDLTQEVFISAFSDLPAEGAKQLKLRPWLYRVATNACLNHLRSRKGLGGDDAAPLDEMPARVDTFEQAETVALVEASLGQLSDRYRTALVLKDLQGLPPAEIAEVMEISRPTADVLVHRARGAFKTAFAKLAGGAAAPASLGLVLAPLSVPAALHLMPPVPHAAPSLPHAAPTAHPAPVGPHAAPALHGPPTGGLLAKLATVAGSKIAIGAAAATLIVAGGAVEVARHADHRNVADAATRSAQPSSTAKAQSASQPSGYWHTRWGCGEWSNHHQWHEMRSWNHHRSQGDTWSHDGWVSHDTSGSGSHDSGSHTWSGGSGSHDGTSSSGSMDSSSSTHDSSSGGDWSSGSHDTWSGGSSGGSDW